MKSSLLASLSIIALTATPVMTTTAEEAEAEGAKEAVEETAPAEEAKEEATEKGATKTKAAHEKTPPSDEVKKATKEAKTFDPQSYGCKDFMSTLQDGNNVEVLGLSLIWLHGYFSATYGTDEMGALSEENVGQIAQDTAEFCAKNPDMNFSRVAKKIYEEE
jgi:hypothetical protein